MSTLNLYCPTDETSSRFNYIQVCSLSCSCLPAHSNVSYIHLGRCGALVLVDLLFGTNCLSMARMMLVSIIPSSLLVMTSGSVSGAICSRSRAYSILCAVRDMEFQRWTNSYGEACVLHIVHVYMSPTTLQ